MYQRLQGGIGIAKLFWIGIQGDYVVMVIEKLGKSLDELKNQCGVKFSFACIKLIAEQIVIHIMIIDN